MDSILQSIEDWFRELLVTGIMDHLTSTFDSMDDITQNVFLIQARVLEHYKMIPI